MRAQAVQRLQSGLFGIAAIVMVVGLANIINDRARQADARPQTSAASSANAVQGSDPLADIGVVPSQQPEPAPRAKAPAPITVPPPAGAQH